MVWVPHTILGWDCVGVRVTTTSVAHICLTLANVGVTKEKIPARRDSQLQAISFDLLFRRRRALRAIRWTRARSSADALNIDRGIVSLTAVLHSTGDRHRLPYMRTQFRCVGIRRNVQLVGGPGFVREREIRVAAAETALRNGCVSSGPAAGLGRHFVTDPGWECRAVVLPPRLASPAAIVLLPTFFSSGGVLHQNLRATGSSRGCEFEMVIWRRDVLREHRFASGCLALSHSTVTPVLVPCSEGGLASQ